MVAIGLEAASAELAGRSEVMAYLYATHGPCRLGRRPRVHERHEALSRSIVFQQLAGSAARAIWARVQATVGEEFSPGAVLSVPPEELRAAGLSGAKQRALTNLAAMVDDGSLDLAGLGRRSDEEIVQELVRVKGIGPWTAQMFLMFSMRRLDVWPIGDLGVRKGFAVAHELAELPTTDELSDHGEQFRPYRSLAAWYCWRAADTVLPD